MELERNTLDHLIAYLKEHGYPDSSFAIEYKLRKQRIDLVIIDPETKIPLIVFEVKSRRSKEVIDLGKKQLENYLKFLPDSSVPAYLVFPIKNEPYFEVVKVEFDTTKKKYVEEKVQATKELDFQMQLQSRLSEKLVENTNKRSDTVDNFKRLSWSLAFVLIIIAVLHKLGCFKIDATDLAMIGAIIGLFILPFSSKMKFLGMEIERFDQKKLK